MNTVSLSGVSFRCRAPSPNKDFRTVEGLEFLCSFDAKHVVLIDILATNLSLIGRILCVVPLVARPAPQAACQLAALGVN